jgi:hypothetical protein
MKKMKTDLLTFIGCTVLLILSIAIWCIGKHLLALYLLGLAIFVKIQFK